MYCATQKPPAAKGSLWPARPVRLSTWKLLFDMPPVGPTASAGRRIRTWKSSQQVIRPRTPDGKAKASRNAHKVGLWLKLRELSRLVNAVVREARDLEGLLLERGLVRGRHVDTLTGVTDF